MAIRDERHRRSTSAGRGPNSKSRVAFSSNRPAVSGSDSRNAKRNRSAALRAWSPSALVGGGEAVARTAATADSRRPGAAFIRGDHRDRTLWCPRFGQNLLGRGRVDDGNRELTFLQECFGSRLGRGREVFVPNQRWHRDCKWQSWHVHGPFHGFASDCQKVVRRASDEQDTWPVSRGIQVSDHANDPFPQVAERSRNGTGRRSADRQTRHCPQQIIVRIRCEGVPESFTIGRSLGSPGSEKLIRITLGSLGQATDRRGRQIGLQATERTHSATGNAFPLATTTLCPWLPPSDAMRSGRPQSVRRAKRQWERRSSCGWPDDQGSPPDHRAPDRLRRSSWWC